MKKKLMIGAYHLQKNARSESHIKDIRDCGIDFIIGMENDPAALDLFEKYGLFAIISGAVPGWWGGFGENSGKMREANPLSRYREYAQRFKPHPAIGGLCIGDEPSVLDMQYFGEVVKEMGDLFPGTLPYLNLYPGYGVTSGQSPSAVTEQLGTTDFGEYLAEYCRTLPLPYLSFDHYVYSSSPRQLAGDLSAASNACREYGRELWVVLQVNSKDPAVSPSENMLRYQAFSAMAYGAERISWACCSAGWWHNNLLDSEGQWTDQYRKLKTVNGEIIRLGEEYMEYRNVATHRIINGSAANCGAFRKVRAGEDGLVGEMVSRDGSGGCAVFICPTEDSHDSCPTVHEVSFRADRLKNIAVLGGDGIIPYLKRADGTYTFPLQSSHGALVVGEKAE